MMNSSAVFLKLTSRELLPVTQTVASFNAVSLLLNDFFDYTPPTSWAKWDDEKRE